MDSCAECGYVYDAVRPAEVPGRIRQVADEAAAACEGVEPEAAARRPAPTTWSVLEYACHIRDVFLVQRERAVLAQVEECPSVARMHRDERVSLCRYDAHPLPVVLQQLHVAAELCASVFAAMPAPAWSRRLIYNWPEPQERDLLWLGRHTVHEGEHHLLDVRRGLASE